MARTILEYTVGGMMIILGILFLFYITNNAANVATDAIFLTAGFLIIRRAYQSSKQPKVKPKPETKNSGKAKQKINTRKRDRQVLV
jgi:hypothetical protein